jgi:putative oxidoreductase
VNPIIEGVAARTFAPLFLRAALAAVFIFHGLDKVQSVNGYGTHWMPEGLPHQPAILQLLVAWGELIGGICVALGLLTRYAAIGLIIIMVGAIVTVTGKNGFGLQTGGFEYNVVLILLSATLFLTGPGTFSLDRVIHVKMRGPAQY